MYQQAIRGRRRISQQQGHWQILFCINISSKLLRHLIVSMKWSHLNLALNVTCDLGIWLSHCHGDHGIRQSQCHCDLGIWQSQCHDDLCLWPSQYHCDLGIWLSQCHGDLDIWSSQCHGDLGIWPIDPKTNRWYNWPFLRPVWWPTVNRVKTIFTFKVTMTMPFDPASLKSISHNAPLGRSSYRLETIFPLKVTVALTFALVTPKQYTVQSTCKCKCLLTRPWTDRVSACFRKICKKHLYSVHIKLNPIVNYKLNFLSYSSSF